MKPTSMPRTLASSIVSRLAAVRSHTGSTPAMAVPATLPTAPIAKATGVATSATTTEATSLPAMIRQRCGTRVKVVRPLRWLHSAVTDRIAMIGRISDIGTLIAEVNVR